jgi:hypothetical protein
MGTNKTNQETGAGTMKQKQYKYTFKNGAYVIAETIEEAMEAIKRDYGAYLVVVKREQVKRI